MGFRNGRLGLQEQCPQNTEEWDRGSRSLISISQADGPGEALPDPMTGLAIVGSQSLKPALLLGQVGSELG